MEVSGVEVGPHFEPYAETDDPVCIPGPTSAPEGHELVPIRIRVTPGEAPPRETLATQYEKFAAN